VQLLTVNRKPNTDVALTSLGKKRIADHWIGSNVSKPFQRAAETTIASFKLATEGQPPCATNVRRVLMARLRRWANGGLE
jgi:hypothetical protein